jgi:mRNA interferase RelE/StbE
MRWKTEIKPGAEKQYLKLDKKTRKKIKESLLDLEEQNNPFIYKNVRPLTGELKGDYRLRVGRWRILFTSVNKQSEILFVYAILPRSDAY